MVKFSGAKVKYTSVIIEKFIRQAYLLEYNTLHFFQNNNYINPCKSLLFCFKNLSNFFFFYSTISTYNLRQLCRLRLKESFLDPL